MSTRYVRHIYRVRHFQRTVALEIRPNRYEPQKFNEEELFTRRAAFLCSHGNSQDLAVLQVTSLLDFATAALAVPAPAPCPPTPQEEEALEEPVPPPGVAELSSQEAATGLQLGAFVVSIQPISKFRRLHRIGACPLLPGRDYRHFEIWGFEFPDAHQYSASCARCFRNATAQEAVSSIEASSSGDSDIS